MKCFGQARQSLSQSCPTLSPVHAEMRCLMRIRPASIAFACNHRKCDTLGKMVIHGHSLMWSVSLSDSVESESLTCVGRQGSSSDEETNGGCSSEHDDDSPSVSEISIHADLDGSWFVASLPTCLIVTHS